MNDILKKRVNNKFAITYKIASTVKYSNSFFFSMRRTTFVFVALQKLFNDPLDEFNYKAHSYTKNLEYHYLNFCTINLFFYLFLAMPNSKKLPDKKISRREFILCCFLSLLNKFAGVFQNRVFFQNSSCHRCGIYIRISSHNRTRI